MKQLKTQFARLLIVFTLLLPWATTEALETFERGGPIASLDSTSFTVEGRKYRIRSGATLQSNDDSRKKLSDFRKGDVIIFQGTVINGVHYVDKIFYYTPVPS